MEGSVPSFIHLVGIPSVAAPTMMATTGRSECLCGDMQGVTLPRMASDLGGCRYGRKELNTQLSLLKCKYRDYYK